MKKIPPSHSLLSNIAENDRLLDSIQQNFLTIKYKTDPRKNTYKTSEQLDQELHQIMRKYEKPEGIYAKQDKPSQNQMKSTNNYEFYKESDHFPQNRSISQNIQKHEKSEETRTIPKSPSNQLKSFKNYDLSNEPQPQTTRNIDKDIQEAFQIMRKYECSININPESPKKPKKSIEKYDFDYEPHHPTQNGRKIDKSELKVTRDICKAQKNEPILAQNSNIACSYERKLAGEDLSSKNIGKNGFLLDLKKTTYENEIQILSDELGKLGKENKNLARELRKYKPRAGKGQ